MDVQDPIQRQQRPLVNYLLVVLGVLLVVGLGTLVTVKYLHKTQPKQAATYTGPVETIRIGNVGEYSLFNLIAQDKGFFTQNGLKAVITEYPSGPPAVADLEANKVDFAIAGDFVGVSNIFSHPDLRILSQASQQFTFSVVARKDKGITTPADLKGKRIGVTKKGAGEFFLGRFLNLHNLLVPDVTEIDLSPATMVSQINNGQIDAIVIFEPHVYNLGKSLDGQIVTWSVQGEEPTLALSYTNQAFIDHNPDVVRRYIKSLAEAQSYLEANDQAARQVLVNDLHYDSAYVNYLWPKIDFRLSLRQSMLLLMEDEARFAIKNNLTTQKTVPNYLDYIYFDALSQESPYSVSIVH